MSGKEAVAYTTDDNPRARTIQRYVPISQQVQPIV